MNKMKKIYNTQKAELKLRWIRVSVPLCVGGRILQFPGRHRKHQLINQSIVVISVERLLVDVDDSPALLVTYSAAAAAVAACGVI